VNVYSTIIGGYGYWGGTSMATPFVSGLAALAWSSDPSLSANQVRTLIESNVDDLGAPGHDDYFGRGRLNAWRTMQAALDMDTTPAKVFFCR